MSSAVDVVRLKKKKKGYIYIYIYIFIFIFAPYPWVGDAVGCWFFDTIAVTLLIRTLEKDYE